MTPATNHADRPVTVREWRGRQVIAKTYRNGGAESVFAMMRALWGSSFGADRVVPGMPEPVAWLRDEGTVLMELVDGQPLATRGTLGVTSTSTRPAAALLGDLHACGVVSPRVRSSAAIVRSIERKAADALPPGTRVSYGQAVEAVRAAASAGDGPHLVTTHGDWSPRNVIASARGPRMIDFDRLQMAHPARDVAYWGAWAWATLRLAGEDPTWDIADDFEDAYLAHRRLAPAILAAALPVHRGAALLRITHGWSALRSQPAVARDVLEEATRQAWRRPTASRTLR